MVILTDKAIISFCKGVAKVSRARIASNRIFGAPLTDIDRAYIVIAYIAGGARVYIRAGCLDSPRRLKRMNWKVYI